MEILGDSSYVSLDTLKKSFRRFERKSLEANRGLNNLCTLIVMEANQMHLVFKETSLS
jgi:hypothetical protein